MFAPLLGAAASIGGMLLNKSQADDNRQAQQENQLRQEALQREFAQNGISWKVEDAKRAGIHPLYAIGAQTTAYSPQSVGSTSTDFSALGEAGQNIGRAIDSTRTTPDKQAAVLQTALATTQLDGLKLDNDIKRAKLNSALAVNRSASPGMPAPRDLLSHYDGSGDAIKVSQPNIKVETKRDVTDPRNPAYIPGSGPSVNVVKNSTGGYSVTMPPELAEAYESDGSGSLDWQIRNRVMPFFSNAVEKPIIPHDPNTEEVIFSPWTNDYRVVTRREKYGPPRPKRFSNTPKR